MNAACECTVVCAIAWVCEAHLGHGIITHLCESDPGSQRFITVSHTHKTCWSSRHWAGAHLPVFTLPWVHISAPNSCLVPQMRNNNHDTLSHCILHRHTLPVLNTDPQTCRNWTHLFMTTYTSSSLTHTHPHMEGFQSPLANYACKMNRREN